MKLKHFLYPIFLLVAACSPKLPQNAIETQQKAHIYPDYSAISLPINIAPINFRIEEDAEQFITHIYNNDKELLIKGKTLIIDDKAWQKLLAQCTGDSIYFDIYAKNKQTWTKYRSISNYITPDSIDPYIVYRLIEPGYVYYENIRIEQRHLENFTTKVVYDNALMQTPSKGQCVNCHSYKNYNKNRGFQMHVRGEYGGTLIENNDQVLKVNLKTDSTISGGVYPSWHPTQDIIAYSVNQIGQLFHSKDLQKIEVQDNQSDLVIYDIKNNEVKHIVHRKDELETFPYWSPQGDALFYASAHYKADSNVNVNKDLALRYKDIHYNIMRIVYDQNSQTFGEIDTIIDAAAHHKSATLPRLNPQGRYLVFTLGDFGNFHIWHKSSDLYLMDLQNNTTRNIKEINSLETESYHSWSSNGQWLIFGSRRDNGSYTRFYISHFDHTTATFSKPFILPQKDPSYNDQLYKSFNIPEFLVKPTHLKAHEIPQYLKREPIQANYTSNKN